MKRAYAVTETKPAPMSDTGSRIWNPKESRRATPGGDVLSVQFDRGVAMVGYGLLVLSVFTAGLPALGALALAVAHSRDTHLITRTHYRNQIRIFWSGVLSFVLGILTGIAAAAFALSRFWDWLTVQFPWLETTVGRLVLPGDRVQVAGWLAVAAIVLFIFGVVHTLFSSLWGAMKLVRGRPIGHIDVD